MIFRSSIYDGDDDEDFASSGCRALCPFPRWASLSCCGIYNQIKYSFVPILPIHLPKPVTFGVLVCGFACVCVRDESLGPLMEL